LFEYADTKKKDQYHPHSMEYVLNPIYAPYFHISYRKKRKLEVSIEDAILLIRGSLNDFSGLMKRYSENWSIRQSDLTPTLFSLIEQEKINDN
jgi:hypothetical protein